MSHFAVLVIGKNVGEKLAPYQENNMEDCPKEYLEFHDVEKEYREKYEKESALEFYCASSSSWGQQIDKKSFIELKESKVGKKIAIEVDNSMHYFQKGKKYKGYYTLEGSKRCKGDQWFEVIEVIETGHPDKDVCFQGRVSIQKISRPKKIKHKDRYTTFKDFIKDWAGHEKDSEGRYGYWENPNVKWDWHTMGGRWRGSFKLKDNKQGVLGSPGVFNNKPIFDVDQSKFGDIDWKSMEHDKDEKDKLEKSWDKVISGDGFHKPEYFKERYGTKEKYIEENTRFSTYAVITATGKWYEPGTMGWWGCSSATNNDEKDWYLHFWDRFMKDLKPDTMLTVVDCHI